MYVRKAKEEDIPAILKLLVQVNMVHHKGRPDLFKGPTTKYSPEELSEILKDDSTPVFVCVGNGGTDNQEQILGHAFCVLIDHKGSRLLQEIRTLYIDDICVDEAARGQHVGRTLYRFAEDYAISAGCYNVTLNVWECNPGARGFYEAMGMQVQKTGMEKIL